METLNINPKFQELLPPLDSEEYENLKHDIIMNGCREKIAVWNGSIVDGHNRYNICCENKIDFETQQKYFKNEDEALLWIYKNQNSRRNLSPYVRAVIALKIKPILEAEAKKRMLAGKSNPVPTLAQGYERTRDEIAKLAGCSHGTLDKVEYIEKNGNEETRKKARKGSDSINAIYKKMKADEEAEHAGWDTISSMDIDDSPNNDGFSADIIPLPEKPKPKPLILSVPNREPETIAIKLLAILEGEAKKEFAKQYMIQLADTIGKNESEQVFLEAITIINQK